MSETNNKRIAKNTIILYFRMVVMMMISLYTSRIVLNALGVDDYGVYSAVGGFIGMFAIMSNSLSAAISRYLTFELGIKGTKKLDVIFSGSLILLLIIGLIILILIETAGVWFLNHKMTIPPDQMIAANWVLQFSAITFIINLISVPYNAVIIAHEKMTAFAYISIFDSTGKLGIAFLIPFFTNRLTVYAALICLLAIIIRFIYVIYCNKNFDYCHVRFKLNKKFAKEIFSFSGWNFIGASSGILRDQGTNVLLNVFCGPAVNAARGVAMQVNTAIHSFSSSFTTALNPQITKQFAAENKPEWEMLVMRGARFATYLLLILSIPIYFEADQLLKIWLRIVPPYTLIFVRLTIILVLIETMSCTLITLMLATGKIRNYQIVVGGLQLLNFPLSWIALKIGYPPQSTILIAIIISISCLFCRILMLNRMVQLNIKSFFYDVIGRITIVTVLSIIIPAIAYLILPDNAYRVLIILTVSIISSCAVTFYIGCTEGERKAIIRKINSLVKKISGRYKESYLKNP